MDDAVCQQLFTHPDQTYQRRYEALRAVFVDGCSQKDVADRFEYTYGSMRQLVLEFRRHCDDKARPTESLFFETLEPGVPLRSRRTTTKASIRR